MEGVQNLRDLGMMEGRESDATVEPRLTTTCTSVFITTAMDADDRARPKLTSSSNEQPGPRVDGILRRVSPPAGTQCAAQKVRLR